MIDWLQYGALGLLGLVLCGVGAAARVYLKDSLATNKELRDMCRALRESLVGQGQRLSRVESCVFETRDLVVDVHRHMFGTDPGRKVRNGTTA